MLCVFCYAQYRVATRPSQTHLLHVIIALCTLLDFGIRLYLLVALGTPPRTQHFHRAEHTLALALAVSLAVSLAFAVAVRVFIL